MVVDVPQEYLWYSECETGGGNNISGTCTGSVFVNLTASVEATVPQYWTYAGYFMMGLLFAGFVVLVVFFKPHYKRLEYELKAEEEEKMRRERIEIANRAN